MGAPPLWKAGALLPPPSLLALTPSAQSPPPTPLLLALFGFLAQELHIWLLRLLHSWPHCRGSVGHVLSGCATHVCISCPQHPTPTPIRSLNFCLCPNSAVQGCFVPLHLALKTKQKSVVLFLKNGSLRRLH